MRSTSPLARLLAAGAFAAALAPQTPVYAAPHVDQWQHIVDCLGWMFSDPDKHRAECSPGHEFFLPYNGFAQTGLLPPPPPPPAPDPCVTPSVYTGEAQLVPVDFCCVSSRSHKLGEFGAALIPVVGCCTEPGSYKLDTFGAAVIPVQSIECDLEDAPSGHWIVRPTLGLLV